MRVGVLRCEAHGFAQVLDRGIGLAHLRQQQSEVVLRLGGIGCETHGRAEVLQRILTPPLPPEQQAEVVVRLGVVGPDADRLTVARDGRLRLPAVAQRVAEVEVCTAELRIESDRRRELLDGFVEAADLGKHDAEIVVGLRRIRLVTQRQPVLCGRVLAPPLPPEQAAEVVVRVRIIGLAAQRRLEVLERRLGLARVAERHAEVVLRDGIVARHAYGVREQGHAVVPAPNLRPGDGRIDAEDRRQRGADRRRGNGPTPHALGHAPGERDEDADQRHVGVAIGVCLAADLYQADDWHQGDEIPEPSDHRVRMAPPTAKHDGRHERQDQRGAEHLPGGDLPAVRIEHREVGRPDRHQ